MELQEDFDSMPSYVIEVLRDLRLQAALNFVAARLADGLAQVAVAHRQLDDRWHGNVGHASTNTTLRLNGTFSWGPDSGKLAGSGSSGVSAQSQDLVH